MLIITDEARKVCEREYTDGIGFDFADAEEFGAGAYDRAVSIYTLCRCVYRLDATAARTVSDSCVLICHRTGKPTSQACLKDYTDLNGAL
jgi:hypothetical protein